MTTSIINNMSRARRLPYASRERSATYYNDGRCMMAEGRCKKRLPEGIV